MSPAQHSIAASTPVACAKPAVDPADRRLAPFGLALIGVFASFWILFSGLASFQMLRFDQYGVRVDAQVLPDNKLRYVDQTGSHEVYAPKGWRNHISLDNTVRLSVLENSSWQPVLAGSTRGQLTIALGLFCVGPALVGLAFYYRHQLKKDAARRARLAALNQRLPAKRFRVAEERVGKSNTRMYRVLATFATPDGRDFEAMSDHFRDDPTPLADLQALRVLFDRDDPRQSLVDTDSLPACTRRDGRRPVAAND